MIRRSLASGFCGRLLLRYPQIYPRGVTLWCRTKRERRERGMDRLTRSVYGSFGFEQHQVPATENGVEALSARALVGVGGIRTSSGFSRSFQALVQSGNITFHYVGMVACCGTSSGDWISQACADHWEAGDCDSTGRTRAYTGVAIHVVGWRQIRPLSCNRARPRMTVIGSMGDSINPCFI